MVLHRVWRAGPTEPPVPGTNRRVTLTIDYFPTSGSFFPANRPKIGGLVQTSGFDCKPEDLANCRRKSSRSVSGAKRAAHSELASPSACRIFCVPSLAKNEFVFRRPFSHIHSTLHHFNETWAGLSNRPIPGNLHSFPAPRLNELRFTIGGKFRNLPVVCTSIALHLTVHATHVADKLPSGSA